MTQTVKAPKAVEAAKGKKKKRGGFDPTLLKTLYEGNPIDTEKHGFISVRVYSYDGSEPKIRIYRVGVSASGHPWEVKDSCPMTWAIANALSFELGLASKWLRKHLRGEK